MAENSSRRDFLGKACLASGCAACAFALGPAVDYLLPRPAPATNGPVTAAKTDEIPEGASKVVQVGSAVILLIRSAGRLTAVDAKCTHLGCVVSWDPKSRLIRCPCHGGVFEADGKRVSGPPPRDLAAPAVRVVGDKIIVGS